MNKQFYTGRSIEIQSNYWGLLIVIVTQYHTSRLMHIVVSFVPFRPELQPGWAVKHQNALGVLEKRHCLNV